MTLKQLKAEPVKRNRAPADVACPYCQGNGAIGTDKRLLATSLADWLEYLPLDYDDSDRYRGGPPLDDQTEYFNLKER